MATVRHFLRRLNDSVACPICLLILDKPKSLPCGHTFCLDCIERVGELRNDYDDDYMSVYSDAIDSITAVTVSFDFHFF